MRTVARQIAFEPNGWTLERRAKVASLFDSLAPEWHTKETGTGVRAAPLLDALARGGIKRWGAALEVGCGTGLVTPLLLPRFRTTIALDLSAAMLALAPPAAPRVRADAACLPVADSSIDALILVNVFLFPEEAERVVTPEGNIVWVNTSGDQTPIHLSAEDVARAMGAGWVTTASEAGWGTWAVLRRRA